MAKGGLTATENYIVLICGVFAFLLYFLIRFGIMRRRRNREANGSRALTRSPDGRSRSNSNSPAARGRRRNRRHEQVIEMERSPANSLNRQMAGRAAFLRDSPPNAQVRDPLHRVPAAQPMAPDDARHRINRAAHAHRHWQGNITHTMDRVRDCNQRLAFFYEMLLSSETVRDLIRDYLRRARRHGLSGNVWINLFCKRG